MSHTYLLSIIVPAYNVQKYIEATITAITSQMNGSHELIIIDDGSSDQTLAILHGLRNTHPDLHINIAEQTNQGVAAARNHGLALARGEYIVFVDSDDLLLPQSLNELENVIKEKHPDVIACDLQFWYPNKESKNKRVTSSFAPHVLTTDKEKILSTYFNECHMFVWSKIFRREIYSQQTLPVFPEGRVYEDVTAIPQLLDSCSNLYYLPHCLINYRQRDGSISKTPSLKSFRELSTALLPARQHFATSGLNSNSKLFFDIALCHIHIGIAKDTYQLPLLQGIRLRREIKATLLDALFHPWKEVLEAMPKAGALLSTRDSAATLERTRFRQKQAKQLQQILGGSLIFDIRQTISRRLRLWRDLLRGGNVA
ncbi:glycosyltransferase family 2 protein [Janthinobacterium sp. J1-1]|uniref:glycosyltransferase family 2 protein n=1 Tax=unclassified Janthinobacterium TaxID=2610881 RepID=UPI0028123545|nr:glycosyltransferase family 2 protein [Janthinobacterium sp. J1-1]